MSKTKKVKWYNFLTLDHKDLEKLRRVAASIRGLASEVVKLKHEDARLNGFPEQYRKYYEVVKPVIGRYLDYSLEFTALPTSQTITWSNVVSGFISFNSFLDEVVKQETLGSREVFENIKEELFIEDNKPFSAYKAVSDVTTKAVKSLKIVDNYMESTSLDFFFGVNSKVEINILTMMLKPNTPGFRAALSKFMTQWGGTIFEVKITNYFHDRYIIVDDVEVWHLGPSLNRLGIKPAVISSITDPDIQKQIVALFDSQWKTATTI